LKHYCNHFQLEALLFGQAGLLSNIDNYTGQLCKEYLYLSKKYGLTPLPSGIWKFMRLRPSNFPTIRIAQFASLLHNSPPLFSRTMHAKNLNELLINYSCSVSEYWKKHYTFGKVAKKQISGNLGKPTKILIITNTIIPFMFAYGNHTNNTYLQEHSLNLLETMPAETNSKIKRWSAAGVKCRHIADSQALIQLTDNYCETANCLNCRIGNIILT
jgi:hypothetical protein